MYWYQLLYGAAVYDLLCKASWVTGSEDSSLLKLWRRTNTEASEMFASAKECTWKMDYFMKDYNLHMYNICGINNLMVCRIAFGETLISYLYQVIVH